MIPGCLRAHLFTANRSKLKAKGPFTQLKIPRSKWSGQVSGPDGAVAAHFPQENGAIVAPKPATVEPAVDDLPWDDPLDQQIASVAEEVVRVQQEWYRLEQGFAPVYHGLEQMEDDLAESPL